MLSFTGMKQWVNKIFTHMHVNTNTYLHTYTSMRMNIHMCWRAEIVKVCTLTFLRKFA